MEETIPDKLIELFAESCARHLNDLSIDDSLSCDEVRRLVVQKQLDILQQVVDDWNCSEKASVSPAAVQGHLRNIVDLDLKKCLSNLDDTVRQTVARLVLRSEVLRESDHSGLKAKGNFERADILEFCGHCSAALDLPCVKEHLKTGADFFDDAHVESDTILPQERVEKLQHHYLRALGYDPGFATEEVRRIFFSGKQLADQELSAVATAFMDKMNNAVATATVAARYHQEQKLFSDQADGGVTRVVSVKLTEKSIDPTTGEVVEDDNGESVQGCEMHSEEKQHKDLSVAQQAARIQQELLGELLTLSNDERKKLLRKAKMRADDFLASVMATPPGAERMARFQEADKETQRLLSMHKLWEQVVANNGGKEPVIDFHNT